MVTVALKLEASPALTRFYVETRKRLEGQILILKPRIYLYKKKYLIYSGKPLIPISPLWIGIFEIVVIWAFLQFHWLMWIGVGISSLSYFETVMFTRKRLLKGLAKAGYIGDSTNLDYEEIVEVFMNGSV